MKDKIEVIVKRPGEDPERKTIKNDLKELQEIVGGHIETVTVLENVILICNEEGLIRGLPYNFTWLGMPIVGPAIFCGIDEDGESFWDLPEELLNNPGRWFDVHQ